MNNFSVRALLKDKKININTIFWICIMGGIILVMLAGTFYAVPAGDDFVHASNMRDALQNNNVLSAIFIRSKDVYMQAQGTFTSTILVCILSSIENIKVVLQINVLLFSFSVIWMGYKMTKNMYGTYDRNALLILMTLFLFMSIGMCQGGREIFYWRTGVLVYTVPMSLTFCCIALYMEYLWEKKNNRKLLLLCIMSFLASGGILQVTAILCYGMLVIWILYWKNHKGRDGILAGLPFVTAFVGALINSVAPGNFARHASYEEGVHIFKAVKNTLKVVFLQSAEVFTGKLMLYVMFFCVICGAVTAAKVVGKSRCFHPLLLGVVVLAGLAVSIFPFCLGYGSSTLGLRNQYICDLYIGWGGAIWALEFGSWLGVEKEYRIHKESILVAVLCIGVIFLRSGDFMKVFQIGTVGKTFAELSSGELQKASSEWNEVFEEICNSEDEDVNVQVINIPETILQGPVLREDRTWYNNVQIARYYGKKSVAVTFVETE